MYTLRTYYMRTEGGENNVEESQASSLSLSLSVRSPPYQNSLSLSLGSRNFPRKITTKISLSERLLVICSGIMDLPGVRMRKKEKRRM